MQKFSVGEEVYINFDKLRLAHTIRAHLGEVAIYESVKWLICKVETDDGGYPQPYTLYGLNTFRFGEHELLPGKKKQYKPVTLKMLSEKHNARI